MTFDIDSCMRALTLEEKISLLSGADSGFTQAVPRLGIPRVLLCDGPHGARVVKDTDPDGAEPYTMMGEMWPSTAFPCEAAMAATWNTELLYQAGEAMGEESQALGVGVLLGPGMDHKRSPLGGRNFEYYSEDPLLTGKLAASFIRGLQSKGVGACMKHYVLNDQETRRTTVNVEVDDRALWEIYLRPFQIAIDEADPWSVMASYNCARGAQVCESREFLTDILRDRLHFQGTVMSDWNAVKDKVKAHKNGLDLQMPGPAAQAELVKEAVRTGEIPEAVIDDRVRRVLRLVQKTCARYGAETDWEKHHEIALQLAREGIVLLKNEEQILPLKQGCKLAVVGELAEAPFVTGGGSSGIVARKQENVLACLGENAQVVYAKGCKGLSTNEELLKEAGEAAGQADVVLVFTGKMSSEGKDLDSLILDECYLRLIQTVAAVNPKVVVVNQSSSAIECRQFEGQVKALLQTWYGGEGLGGALRDILFGAVNPSGKLSETFPVRLENTPAYQHFPGYKDEVFYRESILTGYRYYDTMKIPTAYPFGFGLSYTSFQYSNLRLSAERTALREPLTVTVTVTNTGARAGQETVQLYVADVKSELFRPEKELAAFGKIFLNPGESKDISFSLTRDAFSYYVPLLSRFAVESGEFQLLVGASSQDIRLEASVWVDSGDEVRPPLTIDDLFEDFLKDERYAARAKQIYDRLLENRQVLSNMIGSEDMDVFDTLILGGTLGGLSALLPYLGVAPGEGAQLVDYVLGGNGLG